MLVISVELVDPARTRSLRRRVLRPWLSPNDPLPGDDQPAAVHIAALDGWVVIGTCFVFPEPCPWRPADEPAWHLRQMATAPDRRSEGVGAAVLRYAADYVQAAGGVLLWANARETAAGFYAAHGWLAEGGVFTDAEHTIPHRRVWLPPHTSGGLGSRVAPDIPDVGNRTRRPPRLAR